MNLTVNDLRLTAIKNTIIRIDKFLHSRALNNLESVTDGSIHFDQRKEPLSGNNTFDFYIPLIISHNDTKKRLQM